MLQQFQLNAKSKNLVEFTWGSYLNSKKMSEKQFLDFLVFMADILWSITWKS